MREVCGDPKRVTCVTVHTQFQGPVSHLTVFDPQH